MSLVFSLAFSSLAFADCTSPSAVEGQMTLVSNEMKYCDGTAWVTMNNQNTGSGCSGSVGTVRYNGGNIQYCNGSTNTWWRTAPTTNFGTCAASDAGRFYYNTGVNYYWFCNGANWRKMVNGCAGTLVGGHCWYRGGSNQNCTTVCGSTRGGYHEATSTFAGTSGTLANCTMVATTMGYMAAVNHSCSSTALGCTQGSGFVRRCTTATTEAAQRSGYYRFCACRY